MGVCHSNKRFDTKNTALSSIAVSRVNQFLFCVVLFFMIRVASPIMPGLQR